jgi:hypothetical protein
METRQVFELSSENMQWLADNYDRLKQEFDGKWIAVSGGSVVESSKDLQNLKEALSKHKNPESIVVEYMSTEAIAMFF